MRRLQDLFRDIGDNCCLAIDYLYAAFDMIANKEEKEPTFIEVMIASVLISGLADDETVLSKNGYVNDAEKLMKKATGHTYRVQKKRIESLKELPEKGYAIVNYEGIDGKNNHWILVKDRMQYYNSLAFSNCVAYGKPVDARIVEVLD